jgi:hypothetical protein
MNAPEDSDFHMPPTAYAFVKCYAQAAKQDFHVFMCAAHLMMRGGLEIKCPARAAAVAQELQHMHDEFNLAVSKLSTQHNYRKRGSITQDDAPPEAIVNVLRMSFFKVIKKDSSLATKHDTGWFSGHPFDWKTAIADAMPEPPMWMSGSAIAAAFANLTGYTFNTVDGFPPKQVSFDDYEEEEEDDEDEDDDQWSTDWTGD